MNTVSVRPNSFVTEESTDYSIAKYYKSKKQWEDERDNLNFLSALKDRGITLDCDTPYIIKTLEREIQYQDKSYIYCNIMKRVNGSPSDSDTANYENWIPELAKAIYNLHSQSKAHTADWVASRGQEDALLLHILNDKSEAILAQCQDTNIKKQIERASSYLREKLPLLKDQLTLSHQDINLSNILVTDNKLEGIVDWVTFGITNPTLSLYQLTTKPEVWHLFEAEYKKLGGTIESDVLYAASAIHNAWAALIWAPNVSAEAEADDITDESLERFEELYLLFKASIKTS